MGSGVSIFMNHHSNNNDEIEDRNSHEIEDTIYLHYY